MTQPWHGRSVTWTVDGEPLTASYLPHELVMMRTALERGANRHEIELLHELKAVIAGTRIVDAQAAA